VYDRGGTSQRSAQGLDRKKGGGINLSKNMGNPSKSIGGQKLACRENSRRGTMRKEEIKGKKL